MFCYYQERHNIGTADNTGFAASFHFAQTALGLVPYILIYLIILELFNPVINQVYVWKLVFWSITPIVLRFGFIGLSGTFSHIAAYTILYDLKIKLARKMEGFIQLSYAEK